MNLSLSTPSSSIEQSSTLCKTWCRGIVAVTCWSMMSNGSGGTHHVGRWRKVQLPQLGPPTCLQIPEPSSPLLSIEASCLRCSVCTLHIACNGKTEPFFRGKKENRTWLFFILVSLLFFAFWSKLFPLSTWTSLLCTQAFQANNLRRQPNAYQIWT